MNRVRHVILRSLSTCRGGRLRAYRPGEEARAIDWRASAQSGSLHIREPARDLPLAWALIVDRSASMCAGRVRSLSDAAAEAAAFWFDCATARERRFEIELDEQTGFARALGRALEFLPERSALLTVGDFFEPGPLPFTLLRAAARRFDCTALIARDPWRDGLPIGGFAVFTGLETGAACRCFVGSRARENFMRKVRARERESLALFRGAGWRAVSFDEGDGARALVRAFGTA